MSSSPSVPQTPSNFIIVTKGFTLPLPEETPTITEVLEGADVIGERKEILLQNARDAYKEDMKCQMENMQGKSSQEVLKVFGKLLFEAHVHIKLLQLESYERKQEADELREDLRKAKRRRL